MGIPENEGNRKMAARPESRHPGDPDGGNFFYGGEADWLCILDR